MLTPQHTNVSIPAYNDVRQTAKMKKKYDIDLLTTPRTETNSLISHLSLRVVMTAGQYYMMMAYGYFYNDFIILLFSIY